MKSTLLALIVIACVAFSALAATDIGGRWWIDTSAATAAQGGRGGSVFGGEFEFKISGDVLTGSRIHGGVSRNGRAESVPIVEGKINGNTLSFTVLEKNMNGNEERVGYTGKVVGDRIELTVDFGHDSSPRAIALKRPTR